MHAGLGNAAHFFSRLFPPNFTRSDLLIKGLTESLEIAILASTLGIVLALPIGLAAARNLMPAWLTWPARFVIVAARSLHPVIVAILFVKAVGFGALAGILALTVASIGFIGKLFTEAIEEISDKQVEAIRATGAPFVSVLAYGVLPQVFSRFIGFATYQLDQQPAQLDDGRHRRRRRDRRHAVRRVPALRLRLRLRDPDLDHRAHHGRRGVRDRDPGDLHRERDVRRPLPPRRAMRRVRHSEDD